MQFRLMECLKRKKRGKKEGGLERHDSVLK